MQLKVLLLKSYMHCTLQATMQNFFWHNKGKQTSKLPFEKFFFGVLIVFELNKGKWRKILSTMSSTNEKNSYKRCTQKSTLLLTQVNMVQILNHKLMIFHHNNLCHKTVPFLLSFGWPVFQCIQNIAFEKLLIRHSHLYWVTGWAMLTIPEQYKENSTVILQWNLH